MNPIETGLRRVDGFQRRHKPLAFAFAVNKKFSDDTASNLAALITYYGFLSLLPLLLVLVTVLGMVAGSNTHFTTDVENSALSHFPIIGTHLRANIKALHRNSAFGLVVGLVGMVWGAQGIVSIGQQAMANVWNVPHIERPGFLPRTGRSMLMLAVAAVFLIASTAAAGFASFVPVVAHSVPVLVEAGGYVVSVALNVALYVVAFRILTPKVIPRGQLIVGAVIGGVLWSAVQSGGTLILSHQFKGASELYGVFGLVLGLMAWIFLGARITLYAAEFNVVRARRLWPRSLMQPPLTAADEQVYSAITRQSRYRREQQVEVSFESAVAASGSEPPPDGADGEQTAASEEPGASEEPAALAAPGSAPQRGPS